MRQFSYTVFDPAFNVERQYVMDKAGAADMLAHILKDLFEDSPVFASTVLTMKTGEQYTIVKTKKEDEKESKEE